MENEARHKRLHNSRECITKMAKSRSEVDRALGGRDGEKKSFYTMITWWLFNLYVCENFLDFALSIYSKNS